MLNIYNTQINTYTLFLLALMDLPILVFNLNIKLWEPQQKGRDLIAGIESWWYYILDGDRNVSQNPGR